MTRPTCKVNIIQSQTSHLWKRFSWKTFILGLDEDIFNDLSAAGFIWFIGCHSNISEINLLIIAIPSKNQVMLVTETNLNLGVWWGAKSRKLEQGGVSKSSIPPSPHFLMKYEIKLLTACEMTILLRQCFIFTILMTLCLKEAIFFR